MRSGLWVVSCERGILLHYSRAAAAAATAVLFRELSFCLFPFVFLLPTRASRSSASLALELRVNKSQRAK